MSPAKWASNPDLLINSNSFLKFVWKISSLCVGCLYREPIMRFFVFFRGISMKQVSIPSEEISRSFL